MSNKPSSGESFVDQYVKGAAVIFVIIAQAYLGSQAALWTSEHAWIFTQGMLLVLGLWTFTAVMVGLLRTPPPKKAPRPPAEKKPERRPFESKSSLFGSRPSSESRSSLDRSRTYRTPLSRLEADDHDDLDRPLRPGLLGSRPTEKAKNDHLSGGSRKRSGASGRWTSYFDEVDD